jgi:hypothetical protein
MDLENPPHGIELPLAPSPPSSGKPSKLSKPCNIASGMLKLARPVIHALAARNVELQVKDSLFLTPTNDNIPNILRRVNSRANSKP